MKHFSLIAVLASTTALVSIGQAHAQTLPHNAQLLSGSATVKQTGATQTTITQTSPSAILNWQSFSIGQGDTVDVVQLGATSVLLNRVTGTASSTIAGQLTANGQVFLINPNGIVIDKGGTVQASGFVASTLDISDSDFMSGKLNFKASGSGASVVNAGSIHIAPGGYAALLGGSVDDTGEIVAPTGQVAIGAGTQATLDLSGDGFLQVALPVAGSGTATTAVVSAADAQDLVRQTVNTDGVTEAASASGQDGSVVLSGRIDTSDAGGAGGDVKILGNAVKLAGGVIDAGNAHVETSGNTVDFTGVKVSAGDWLVDPVNLTVDSAAAATISSNLSTTDITLQTTATGASSPGVQSSGAGDIIVDSGISWGSSHQLTLDAYHGISILAPITVTGAGKVAIVTDDGGTGGDYDFGLTSAGFTGSLNFTGGSGSGAGLTINGTPYRLLYSMGDIASTSFANGHFALAQSLDASGISYGAPVTNTIAFDSVFDGLGHTVSNVKIVYSANWAGFFSFNDGTVRDIGLIGGSVNGAAYAGDLVAYNNGTLSHVYATGTVNGTSDVGGLVGQNNGNLTDAYTTGTVIGATETGGLVGENDGGITNAYATGSVTGVNTTGGLAGLNDGSITNAYATGAVVGQNNGTGGLIGSGYGSLTDVYATGFVMGQNSTGGLIGYNDGGSVTAGYYDSQTTGRASGLQSDGSQGLTTAQLQGALPAGFSSSAWGTGAGLYPYLNWQYATAPQAITGTAISLYPTTPLAGASVNVYTNGGDVGAATTGANGYYYVLVPGNTIKYNTPFGTTLTLAGDSGVDAMTYSDTHTVTATTVANVNTQLGRNYVFVSDSTLSALFAGMGAAFGPSEMAYLKTTAAFNYQDLYSNAPTFTIDQPVDVTSVFEVTEINPTGTVIDAAPITVESGATLMWTANGALQINAPISVKGSGEINLHYDYYQTSSGGVADPTAFSFGNGGSVSYLTSSGGVATSQQGGQFVLNNIEYTLIYTLSQLDSIDGINGVSGASEGVFGPGLNGNYALADTLNAAGTTYGRELVNNFEGTFEGLNNSIDNLTIKDNGATSDAVGLFGALHGTARDINLVNVSIAENAPYPDFPEVGGLAGYSDGSVYNVSVSGDVNVTSDLFANVGGVIGYAPNGTIYNARASDTVEGSAGDNLGGLVGLSYAATISQSSATGNVTGTYAEIGGLVGFTQGGTTISQSYATGNISGGTNSAEGGLVGYNLGTIKQSYATGDVTATSNTALGGLVGANSGAVILSYWDTDTSGQSTSAGGSKLTTAQLQSGTLPAGFAPAVWTAASGQYPKLKVAGQ